MKCTDHPFLQNALTQGPELRESASIHQKYGICTLLACAKKILLPLHTRGHFLVLSLTFCGQYTFVILNDQTSNRYFKYLSKCVLKVLLRNNKWAHKID